VVSEIDCRVFVDGVQFPDTAADLEADIPTVLADVEVTWGRATNVDQPNAATTRAVVLDRSGGSEFIDTLDVGKPLAVWASGDISTGDAVDVAVDGSFETLTPSSDASGRVWPVNGTATVVTNYAYRGVQSIRVDPAAGKTINYAFIPPKAFEIGGLPANWDDVPTMTTGSTWTWSLAVRAGYGVSVDLAAMAFDGPTDHTGSVFGQIVFDKGDNTWHVVSREFVVPSFVDGRWLGVWMRVRDALTWARTPGTWAATPGTWAQYSLQTWIDALELHAPASGNVRDVLVFSGRVTDLAAAIDDDQGTLRVEVTAVDQFADLQNRYVGDIPWLSQSLLGRVTNILAAAAVPGLTISDVKIDTPFGALVVSWRDVDRQPAGGLLSELAQGVDGVLWSATHATTGPYLWYESPANRATVGTLALVGQYVTVTVVDPNRAPGRTVLDGCDLAVDEVQWVRDVTDVITRVSASWLEQTVDTEGKQQPTERTVEVVDTAAEGSFGARSMSVATQLVSASDATAVANRILARTRQLQWRAEGLTWDLGRFPPTVEGTPPVPGSPGYLTPTVGTVTTPDPGPLPNQFTLVYEARGPIGSGQNGIAGQWESGQLSWDARVYQATPTAIIYSNDGTTTRSIAVNMPARTGTWERHALAVTLNDGAGTPMTRMQIWNHTGTAWAMGLAGQVAAWPTMRDATSVMRIGGPTGALWDDAIRWVELRTGLDPAAGSMLWRFDASDYPGTGTSYTDPRGRTWTLTNPAAITPKVDPQPGNITRNGNVDALDLLDGTIRLGRALIVDDVAHWPGGTTIGGYLDGGRYHYDGDWNLAMAITPMAGMGQSGGWNTLNPAWRWNQMHPALEWADLWGVTGPITQLEEAA
jgi:hypothetical protein